jgi:hypothetical protein
MILVDTSVWIGHLRRRSDRLAAQLDLGVVACHPFVIGELALGTLRDRSLILVLLSKLPAVRPARHDEVLAFVERRELQGTGIGWVDAHLLASALMDRLPLWTLDRRLAEAARRLRAGWNG